ncbi:MAG: hypothetical protein ACRDP5_17735 [Streptosporangiaceae bacterium]
MAKKTVKVPGKKPIQFQPGGLHRSLDVPAGQKIPPAKMAGALAGKAGPKAAAQARFAQNVLTGPKKSGGGKKRGGKTAAKGK